MTHVAWRAVHRTYSDDPFGGRGSRIFGGRWNHPGTAAVYTSATLSLAILEILVHTKDVESLPDQLCYRVELPDDSVETISESSLPSDWKDRPDHETLRERGNAFLLAGATVAIRIPSAVVPIEWNYVLNPLHPRFSQAVKIDAPIPMPIDRRLLGLAISNARHDDANGQ